MQLQPDPEHIRPHDPTFSDRGRIRNLTRNPYFPGWKTFAVHVSKQITGESIKMGERDYM
jgi:hypothetical protein